jgi:hypothetical protein
VPLSIYVCKGKLLLMVLNEAKLRVVIREELTQYLIEQGFLQRVGSGIKSAYQKLTGGGQQTGQQQTQPQTINTQITSTETPDKAKQEQLPVQKQASNLTLNIKNEQDVNNFIKTLNSSYTSNKRITTQQLIKLLHTNFSQDKQKPQFLQVYRKFVNKLDELYRHNVIVATQGVGGTVSQIRKNISEQQQTQENTHIENVNVLVKLLDSVYNFFTKQLPDPKTKKLVQRPDKEKLHTLHVDRLLFNEFVKDVTGQLPKY